MSSLYQRRIDCRTGEAWNACAHAPALCIQMSRCTLMPYFMSLFLLLTVLRWFSPCNRKNVHPSHRGAMEDQSPGGKGCGCLSPQDTNPPERDITSHREHEGWVLAKDASLCTGQIILRLRADQEFTVGGR